MKLIQNFFLLVSFFCPFILIQSMELDLPRTCIERQFKKAIRTGNVNAIKALAKNHSTINLDKELFNTFRSYLSACDKRKVEVLIESGANVNQQDENGNTLLHHFFTLLTPELVKFLLAAPNINPSIKNNLGHTPIDVAQERIDRDSKNIVAAVLDHSVWLITNFRQ